jgi:hypothetical protein
MAKSPAQLRTLYPFIPDGPFTCHGELTAAISDPRYADDDAFRETVAAKLAATDRQAWNLSDTREAIFFTSHRPALADDEIGW